MKKLVSLFCCVFVLTAMLAGCTNKTPDPSSGTTGSFEETEAQTDDLYDENGYLKDSIPEDLDFGGEDVLILGWEASEAKVDFDVDYSQGAAIPYQTYLRNEEVKERLNVNLVIDATIPGNNANRFTYLSTVEMRLGAGEACDLIACYSMNAANFSADGYTVDLKSCDALDFEKPWWSSDMLKNSVVNNKLYFASGSLSASSILQTIVMAVNMDTVLDFDLEDPRQLVLDGTWTMEKFYQMCSEKYIDTNTDIPGKDNGDSFGYASYDSVMGDGFLAGNNLHYLSTDESGKLVLSPEFKDERTFNLSETLITKFKSDDYLYESATNGKILTEGRAMFVGCNFSIIMNNRAKMDYSYGYVPFPKADTQQKDYYSTCGFPYTMWSMTTNCKNRERAAYVLEALASTGYRTVQPEIYNQIKYRGNSDALNAEMFDLIIASKTYDMGRIFHNRFEWAESPVALFRTRMYRPDDSTWYSVLGGYSDRINTVLKSINESFGY